MVAAVNRGKPKVRAANSAWGANPVAPTALLRRQAAHKALHVRRLLRPRGRASETRATDGSSSRAEKTRGRGLAR